MKGYGFISLVLVLIFSSYSTNAQLLNMGIKAGINVQELKISEFEGQQTISEINSGDKKVGFHGGLYININTPIFQIRPEFLYTYVNHSITTTSFNNEINEFDFKFNRFDVPILLGKQIGPLRLNIGPVMSFTISNPDEAFDKGVKDATWGYQAGIGIDINGISVDLRYEGPFSKITDSITIDGQDYQTDARGNQILVSIGFELF